MTSPSADEENPIRSVTRSRVSARRSALANRTPRKTVTRQPVEKRASVRRRVTRKNLDEIPVTESESVVEDVSTEPSARRKAPTPIAAEQAAKQQNKRQLIVVSVVLLLGFGASAGVAMLDQGEIDVNKTIEARNQRSRTTTADERDRLTSQVEVPVQNTQTANKAKGDAKKADGGLIGLGTGGSVPKPVGEIVTTVATTSTSTPASTATSTESGAADSNATTTESTGPSNDTATDTTAE